MAGNTLQHFQKTELLITRDQALRVLRFFFPDQPVDPVSITDDDIGFAQSLLLEAVSASKRMGYVETVFKNAYMKPPTDFSFISDLAKDLVKRAAGNWFKGATKQTWRTRRSMRPCEERSPARSGRSGRYAGKLGS